MTRFYSLPICLLQLLLILNANAQDLTSVSNLGAYRLDSEYFEKEDASGNLYVNFQKAYSYNNNYLISYSDSLTDSYTNRTIIYDSLERVSEIIQTKFLWNAMDTTTHSFQYSENGDTIRIETESKSGITNWKTLHKYSYANGDLIEKKEFSWDLTFGKYSLHSVSIFSYNAFGLLGQQENFNKPQGVLKPSSKWEYTYHSNKALKEIVSYHMNSTANKYDTSFFMQYEPDSSEIRTYYKSFFKWELNNVERAVFDVYDRPSDIFFMRPRAGVENRLDTVGKISVVYKPDAVISKNILPGYVGEQDLIHLGDRNPGYTIYSILTHRWVPEKATEWDINFSIYSLKNVHNYNWTNIGLVSIQEPSSVLEDFRVDVFPNPTSDKVRIEANQDELITVFVYDVNGKLCLQSEFLSATELDVTHVKPGIYFLNVNIKGKRYTKKFVKN